MTTPLADSSFLEGLYEEYQAHPTRLSPSWRRYFEELEAEVDKRESVLSTLPITIELAPRVRIEHLIDTYRRYGHLFAKLNPIALAPLQEPDHLKLESLGFSRDELSTSFPTCGLLPHEHASLQEILERLQSIYCGSVGAEYKELFSNELEKWLESHLEASDAGTLSLDQKKLILDQLNRSELLESFLHTKFVGQKRFSLEGAETLIPMLAALIEKGASLGVEEVVLGMAHRGRLNVLSNILNKSFEQIFSEFSEHYVPDESEGMGDVKYHKGYVSEGVKTLSGKKVAVMLSPNPSHLESVDPVVEGRARARQFLKGDEAERKHVLPILIHGDAALSGQGVVYETLQLARLRGYTTGGTVHFVINNQIGFTTVPRDLRSTHYCTDIAHAFGIPVFHVNAEDPEKCVWVTLLAIEMRQKFHCDVLIDLNSYRKYGHNEGDEPAFTQPLEYQLIKKKLPIRTTYRDALIREGVVEKQLAEQLEEDFKTGLQSAHGAVKESDAKKKKSQKGALADPFQQLATGVEKAALLSLAERFCTHPETFHLHPKLEHLVKERLSMAKGEKPIDWGMAETLAFATLLNEGKSIRLSGQDVCRGTFSHRHAMWVDQVVEREYFPLCHLKKGQGKFEIVNSSLSEMAALGFEYGYSIANPQGLTIWEAQFGDFANGAQVIIDQYIASGEQKWGQRSPLVLLLPHGYEGQGPEHSSGRLERFLSLSGHDNIQVVNPTTPAQLFHLLRRQTLRSSFKPLIVFTPKGLLRHPACVSTLDDLEKGAFAEVLDDPQKPKKASTVVLCSGRIAYDLFAAREKSKNSQVAIIRIEQLYPFHAALVEKLLAAYKGMKELLWVQEEPQNMGAWHFIRSYIEEVLPSGVPLRYVGRETSSTPATGSHSRHIEEHTHILKQVFHHDEK